MNTISSLQDTLLLPLFGWLGQQALLVGGVLAVAVLTARRARARGISPSLPTNQIALGLLIGLPMALHLLFTWQRLNEPPPPGQSWSPHPELSILAALLGGLLLAALLLRSRRLPLLTWLDVCTPAVLLGYAIAHTVSFFEQPGSGGGLSTALAPAAPALLDGLIPPLATLGALLWAEHHARGGMRPGDSALLCGLLYALGHLIAIALHAGGGGATLALSLATLAACAGALLLRRVRISSAHRSPSRAAPSRTGADY